MHEDQSILVSNGVVVELTRELHPPVSVLAGTGDILYLILHWLAHTKVKS